MTKETLKDVSIVYLFIKSFEWMDVGMKEQYQGHPKPGSVYRSFYNASTGNYKIFVGNAMFITDSLVVLPSEEQSRVCDIYPLQKDNILELNPSEEQLDNIIAWEANSNKEIKSIYQEEPKQGLGALHKAMNQQELEEAQDMAIARKVLGELHLINTSLFRLIVEVASALSDHDIQLHENGAMMTLELSDHGAGYNIGTAIKKLNKYLTKPKRGGDDREDVVDAIVKLFTELDRRALLNLDDE